MHSCDELQIPPGTELSDAILTRSTPVICRGLFNQWPIVEAAQRSVDDTIAYIRQLATEEPVVVYRGDDSSGRIFFNDDYTGYNFTRKQQPISEILHEIKQNIENKIAPSLYVGSTMVERWLPNFSAENPCHLTNRNAIASLWMGTASQIAAHYDCPNNLAVCAAGTRTFKLFAPDQVNNLYVGPLDQSPSGRPISLVDVNQPDFDRHPKFREALTAGYIAELNPGDALFIPPLWWHHVTSNAPFNILINYWWAGWPSHMGNPEAAFEHAILTIRGLPDSYRQGWKSLFEHYVFADESEATKHLPKNLLGILDKNNVSAHLRLWNLLKNKIMRQKF